MIKTMLIISFCHVLHYFCDDEVMNVTLMNAVGLRPIEASFGGLTPLSRALSDYLWTLLSFKCHCLALLSLHFVCSKHVKIHRSEDLPFALDTYIMMYALMN